MSSVHLRGTLTPLRQRVSRRWHPENGWVVSEEFKTFNSVNAGALLDAYAHVGVEVEWSESFGVHVITTTDTRGEQRIDRWDMAVDEEYPSEYQNPRNVALLGLSRRDLSLWKQGLANESDWDTVWEQMFEPDNEAELGELYEAMQRGNTQYRKNCLCLVHTTNVSNRYEINIADTNVNRIYTHAQFLSECLDTNLWVFPLPGAVEYALTYFYNDNEPTPREGTLWGWLKSGSPRSSCANNRIDIVTRFKLDQWRVKPYGTV